MSKVEMIKSYIIRKIEDGSFRAGDKLPSIRQLAQQFSCNKDTVQRAFLDLRYERYVHAVAKSGYYVFEQASGEQEKLDLPHSELANLAYDDFRLCLNETVIGREDYLFNYFHKQEGLPDLLQAVHALLAEGAVYTSFDQLVITAGTQQALYILTQLDFPNSKTDILLEQPTYHRMVSLVKQQHLPYQTIERTFLGLDFDELERLFAQQSIKFFYLIPRLHNPLGTSYRSHEMKRLIALAEQYDVYLVEDDYMSDFADKAPLHYYDTSGRVIYLKSFSNAIFPALRLAAVCLPQNLKDSFIAYKKLMDYDTNLILQKALALYLTNGMYAKNTQQLRQRYKQQLIAAQRTLSKVTDLPAHSLTNTNLILQLPHNLSPAKIKQTFEQVNFLQDCYMPSHQTRFMQVTDLTILVDLLAIIKNQD